MNAHYQRHKFFITRSLRGHSLVQILIYTNLVMFTLMVLHGTVLGHGMQVILSPDIRLLRAWGAQYWPFVFQLGDIWRCISYAYMHGGIIHLGFNMVVLYQIGPLIEAEVGWQRFFVIYTVTGIVATLAGLLLHPQVTVVGASGALFGIFGFAVSYYHRIGGSLGIQRRNFLFQWVVIALVFGFVVGADNAAHVGGLLGGAAFGWLIPTTIRAQRKTDSIFNFLAWLFVVLTALSLLLVLVTLVLRYVL
ncbi:rhomboid family intramembrane serine protease [Malonomonas rubra]|uniref:rhomboid family intramembrane serine protease n=1 Tax=Malonomonas rubra TaxID=57040 RepID=UPI0026ED406E|nr:rhomboid family intramembrane serine protease [Malonomonas rubra]